MVKMVELSPDPAVGPNAGANAQQQQQNRIPPPEEETEAEDAEAPSWARFCEWVENDNADSLHTLMDRVCQRIGYTRTAVFWIGVALLTIVMVRTPALAPFLCNAVSIGTYSMKGTLTALALRQWEQLSNWLVYWLVFQGFSVMDYLSKSYSFYYPAKMAIMAYFHSPPLFGARYLRRRWVDPLIYDGPGMKTTMQLANPWLLKNVYKLDRNALNSMQEWELRDCVNQLLSGHSMSPVCGLSAAVAGIVSPTGFLLPSPLTTPRNTPRSTPIPHRLLLDEAGPELAGLVQSIMTSSGGAVGVGLSGGITSGEESQSGLLKEVSDQFLNYINSGGGGGGGGGGGASNFSTLTTSSQPDSAMARVAATSAATVAHLAAMAAAQQQEHHLQQNVRRNMETAVQADSASSESTVSPDSTTVDHHHHRHHHANQGQQQQQQQQHMTPVAVQNATSEQQQQL